MTFIVGAFGSGFYIAYLIFRNEGYCCDWSKTSNYCHVCTEWGFVAFIGFLIGLAIAFIVGVIVAAFTSNLHLHKVTYKADIANLKMIPSVSGTFLLGSGSIDQKPVYYYYTKDSNRQYRLHYKLALESTIVEDNSQKPSIVTTKWEWKWDIVGLLLSCVACPFPLTNEKHTFTIPEGSIVPNFQPL